MTLVAPRIVNDVSYVMRINIDSCSFSAKFHGLDLLCHFRNPAVLLMHRFLFIQLFFQQSLSISNTDFICLIV